MYIYIYIYIYRCIYIYRDIQACIIYSYNEWLSCERSLKACDALSRAYTTAKHAQKLSTAAAEQFGNEASVLAEAKGMFEAIKNIT
jgi:hypothetical protein